MTLAQSNSAQLVLNQALPWLIALVVLTIITGALLFYLNRRFFGESKSEGDQVGGLFDELRAMRDRGEISDDEYEMTRLTMIARATGKDVDQLRADAIRKAGGMVARPGFDLTGAPLPGPPQSENPEPPPGNESPDPGP